MTIDFQDELMWRAIPALAVSLYEKYAEEISEYGHEAPILAKLAALAPPTSSMPDVSSLPATIGDSGVPVGPGPILTMLLGGLGGAALGYGGGHLAKYFFPKTWNRKRIPTTAAILGGLAGASPGLLYGLANLAKGDPFNTRFLQMGYKPIPRPTFDAANAGKAVVPMKNPNPELKYPGTNWNIPRNALIDPKTYRQLQGQWQTQQTQDKVMGDIGDPTGKTVLASIEKVSFNTGLGAFKPIPVDAFNQVIWQDPRVASRLPAPLQAAATGAVTSAANLPGKTSTKLVTPMDMGRIAAGMGSGYVSGAIVGATLGTLLGMPPETQNKLKQTGMFAGIVANVVPKIFGG